MAMNNSSEMTDERYSVADEAIRDAFLLLLKDRDFEKITVADVIKKAGIVRSTFYKHYENLQTLVTAVEDQTIQDIFSLMESFHPKSDRDICSSFFLSVCRYTITNPFLASILRSPSGDRFFEKAMTMFHRYVTSISKEWVQDQDSREEFSYMIACAIGSTLGVLHKWTADNLRTDPQQVADVLTRNFMAGVLPFIK